MNAMLASLCFASFGLLNSQGHSAKFSFSVPKGVQIKGRDSVFARLDNGSIKPASLTSEEARQLVAGYQKDQLFGKWTPLPTKEFTHSKWSKAYISANKRLDGSNMTVFAELFESKGMNVLLFVNYTTGLQDLKVVKLACFTMQKTIRLIQ